MQRLEQYRAELAGKDAAATLAWALNTFGVDGFALATSFGPEDQVLTALLASATPRPRIFTLDTGRLFEETYTLMQQTIRRYAVTVEVHAPDAGELAALVGKHGPNLFYESVEKRHACCELRKVRPLRRALTGLSAWVCGLRRDQGPTRAATRAIAWDAEHGLYKLAPLHDWSATEVWRYLHDHGVPFNELHARGFLSIGCAPCTRALAPGQDERAGRWWWEQPNQRECGLHRPGRDSVTTAADPSGKAPTPPR